VKSQEVIPVDLCSGPLDEDEPDERAVAFFAKAYEYIFGPINVEAADIPAFWGNRGPGLPNIDNSL
jgi:hypothetical protein